MTDGHKGEKMKEITVSVIIPVYNVEKYLEKCVSSVEAQKLPGVEIILVDDGSKDSSGEICDRLALGDDRIRVIHKENGGLSDARNRGMDLAEGKYLLFLDSDDYLEDQALELLYGMAERDGSEIAIGGIIDRYAGSENVQSPEIIEFTCSGSEALGKMLAGNGIPGSACNKLFLRSLLAGKSFIKGRTYEDAFFLPEVMPDAEKVSVTTRPTYDYVHRSGSITTVKYDKKALDVIDAYRHTLEIVRERCPEHIPAAEFRLQWAHFVVLDRMLASDGYRELEDYSAVAGYLKKNWMKIVKSRYFRNSRRLAAAALKINVRSYSLLLGMRNRRQKIIE